MVTGPPARLAWVLYASVLVIATCGLVYELGAGAMATYLLGNSVLQFSLVIGTYLSAMGVGSWLSRFLERDLLARFIEVEVAVALVGGFHAPILFGAFAVSSAFAPVLYGLVALIGIGVGLELPLLMRILEDRASLRELVARVLFLDYVGALLGSVLFPMVLVPQLGLLRTSLAFGLANAGVALWGASLFGDELPPRRRARLQLMAVGALGVLAVGFVQAGRYEHAVESRLFADPVVYRAVTPYQHIAITHRDGDTRLFLNGALQFSSVDEYRYHEALAHPALISAARPERVLILGGGDGLAIREVLRHAEVREVVLVDLDRGVTDAFRDRDELAALNRGALRDPRVTVVHDDAFVWLQRPEAGRFDVALVDFPDPNDYALGKLYTTQFYRLLAQHLSPGGVVAVQATSPMFSPDAYWCVVRTLEHEGWHTRPYHAYVPAFGEWGFVLAAREAAPAPRRPLPADLRFLDEAAYPLLFHFPRDMARRDGPINRMDNQALVRLYEEDWREIVRQ